MKISVDGWAWIEESKLSGIQAEALRRRLTLVGSVNKKAITHRAYREKDGLIGVPRAFFRASISKSNEISYTASNGAAWPERKSPMDGDIWSACQGEDAHELVLTDAFTGVKSDDFFSEDQQAGINKMLKVLGGSSVGDGIAFFSSEQAAAKVCLALIQSFRLRTVVIVPPGAALAMWRTVIGRYLPDAKLSVIQRGERDNEDAHITLSTLDDLHDFMSHDRIADDEFGFVISHQIDRLDPMAWARVVPRMTAARRLGISSPGALFTAGMARVYRYHLGDAVFCATPDLAPLKVRRVWSSWKVGSWSSVNPQFISKENLLDTMCASTIYNKHVTEQIILAMSSGRKILVVSERIAHLNNLRLQIEAAWNGEAKIIDLAVEGLPHEDVAMAIKADVILTTFSSIKDLPEISDLDTVVLATPVKDPGPAARMCLVKDSDKKPPVIVDMRCEDIPVCKAYGKVRDNVYTVSFGIDSQS